MVKPMAVPSMKTVVIVSALFLLAGFFLYGGVVIYGGFLFDDYDYVVENRMLEDLSNFCSITEARYVPYLTFAVQRAVNGLDPSPYRLVNVLIHITNALLIYLIVAVMIRLSKPENDEGGLLGQWGIPFMAALVFLTHPLATQSVSYITQRFSSLAAFFYVLAAYLYLEARAILEEGPQRSTPAYMLLAGGVLAALLGMKTKEICFTLPFALLALDLLFFPRSSLGNRRYLALAPFFLAAFVIPLSLYGPEWGVLPISHGGISEMQRKEKLFDLENRSGYEYLLTQFRVVVTYLRLMVVPYPLKVVYDIQASTEFFSVPVMASLAFLASLFSAGVLLIRRSLQQDVKSRAIVRLAGIGIIWFFVTISVESSFIPIKDLIFEHRTYLPSVGAYLAIVSLASLFLASLWPGRALRYALTLFLGIALLLGAATLQRNGVWADEIAFWDEAVEHAPGRPIVWNNRAMVLYRRGDFRAALRDMNISVDLAERAFPRGIAWTNPDISQAMLSSTYRNRAAVHYALGDYASAEADQTRAVMVMAIGRGMSEQRY